MLPRPRGRFIKDGYTKAAHETCGAQKIEVHNGTKKAKAGLPCGGVVQFRS